MLSGTIVGQHIFARIIECSRTIFSGEIAMIDYIYTTKLFDLKEKAILGRSLSFFS